MTARADTAARRHLVVLGIIVVVAALVRFANIAGQSFWEDELFTVWLTHMDFGEMMSTIPSSEATPPMYYVVVWAWARLFGSGELALRSLSALAGIAAVPLSYLAVAQVTRKQVALALSALVALNPFLVWYSQEARAYTLMVPLSALILWSFLRAVDGRAGIHLWLWSLWSALALCTHYFAIFLIVPTGAWLIVAAPSGRRWKSSAAVAAPAIVALALTPLLLYQRDAVGDPGGLGGVSLLVRLAAVPKNFLVGYAVPQELLLTVTAAALSAAGGWLALRSADRRDRQTVKIVAAVGATSIAIPTLLALVGQNYLASRNVVMSLVPFLAVLAIGIVDGRRGFATGLALMAVWLFAVVVVAADPAYQRKDWRGAAAALGEPAGPRALVFSPYFTNPGPFRVYFGSGEIIGDQGATVDEIAVVALPSVGRYGIGVPRPPRGEPPAPPEGFKMVERVEAETFTLVRYHATAPTRVSPQVLKAMEVAPEAAAYVFQRPT